METNKTSFESRTEFELPTAILGHVESGRKSQLSFSSLLGVDILKRTFDLVASMTILLIVSPVILLGWLLVRLTSPGPGIYTQVRVGRSGKNFSIIKLRTMTHNCEAISGGPRWSTKGDSRVTPIGKIFRKLHIDELPQLFNVIKGDMSLVGPRPERPEFVTPLAAAIPGYLDRLAVKPGVTGLAQIQLPPDSDVESVHNKIVLDRAYIEHQNLWLDIRLIVATGVYLCGVSYRNLRRIFRLPSGDLTRTNKVSNGNIHFATSADLLTASFPRETLPRIETTSLVGPRV